MSTKKPHLKEVEHDNIEDIDPNELMESISKTNLTKTVVISFIFHIIFIGVLSIGYISQCVKYKTLDVKGAIKLEKEALKKQEEEKRKAELIRKAKEKAKAAAQQKAAPKQAATSTATGADGQKKVPKVLKEINEVSKEKPKGPSVKSLDDDLDIDSL